MEMCQDTPETNPPIDYQLWPKRLHIVRKNGQNPPNSCPAGRVRPDFTLGRYHITQERAVGKSEPIEKALQQRCQHYSHRQQRLRAHSIA